jgi:GNAT superfamily N-acetyltransferase
LIKLRRATDADSDAVAEVWLSSYKQALPTVQRAHDDADVYRYTREHWVAQTECWVADDDGQVVAMMVLAPGWVEQLYVAPSRQGEGVGRLLLDRAKERSDGNLQLWTFQVNDRARRFYERNGFAAVEMTDGATNEEREPDVRYVWSAG